LHWRSASAGAGGAPASIRGEVLTELTEIGSVASERVRRGVLLHFEVPQKRSARIGHATGCSTSRRKSQPARAQDRVVRLRATRSTVKGASHSGHGSATGRCHSTNLQVGYAEQPHNVRPRLERRWTSTPWHPDSGP